jgi:hypothetical protein
MFRASCIEGDVPWTYMFDISILWHLLIVFALHDVFLEVSLFLADYIILLNAYPNNKKMKA